MQAARYPAWRRDKDGNIVYVKVDKYCGNTATLVATDGWKSWAYRAVEGVVIRLRKGLAISCHMASE
jgi:hypothetical protein